jgi:capsular polysaccharide biosynthesis protein
VELMAGTGILIAPHGAHLANAMFMPQRSAVIEVRRQPGTASAAVTPARDDRS